MPPLLLFALALALVVGGILVLRIHAFFALIAAAAFVAVLTPAPVLERTALERGASPAAAAALARTPAGERVGDGFGRTAGQIGLLIVMASLIGTALLDSGGADRIVRSALAAVGVQRAPAAFLGSGFLLAIPVFFDTVFYMLIPLVKATWVRTGQHYVFYILAIIAGGTMTHSLVPPTPGPLFIASELGVSLAILTIAGCLVGACAATAGYVYAGWMDRRWPVPLRDPEPVRAELERMASMDTRALPPLWLSLLPIVLPIVLITAQAFTGTSKDGSPWAAWLRLLGEKNVALSLGAFAAVLMLWRAAPDRLARSVAAALTTAGTIILITSAGGAFGSALQQLGLGSAAQSLIAAYSLPVLPLAFMLTAVLRTALGSATVAMITSAGALGSLATAGSLGFHPVYLALAIGCGSKPIWWMNDSAFWIITQMSGFTERESLRYLTPMSIVVGLTGLAATMIGAAVFPMT
jgi:GntP family gluconate:H+ symporter